MGKVPCFLVLAEELTILMEVFMASGMIDFDIDHYCFLPSTFSSPYIIIPSFHSY